MVLSTKDVPTSQPLNQALHGIPQTISQPSSPFTTTSCLVELPAAPQTVHLPPFLLSCIFPSILPSTGPSSFLEQLLSISSVPCTLLEAGNIDVSRTLCWSSRNFPCNRMPPNCSTAAVTENCPKGLKVREKEPQSAWAIRGKIPDWDALELTLKDADLFGRQAVGVQSGQKDGRCQARAL